MDIVEEREGDVLVLVPVGRLDTTTSRDFEKRLLELVNGGNIHYVIDFARLEYVSSAGLRVLVMLGKRLPGMSGSLVLATLSPQVREVFDIAGFTRVFQIVADRKQALAETERQRLGKPGKAAPKAAAKPAATAPAAPAAAKKGTAEKAEGKDAAKPAAKAPEKAAEKTEKPPAAKKAAAEPAPAPAAAAPAPKKAAAEPVAAKAEPAAPAPAAAPAAEPAKPRQRSVEELAIELLRKGEAPPFLGKDKK
jgi:anti-anti-sigma factor